MYLFVLLIMIGNWHALYTFKFFQETVTSASSITHGLTSELLDGQRKLLSLVTFGSPIPHSTGTLHPTNGPVTSLPQVL
jgi:enhancer of mRNA-decapping protein 4